MNNGNIYNLHPSLLKMIQKLEIRLEITSLMRNEGFIENIANELKKGKSDEKDPNTHFYVSEGFKRVSETHNELLFAKINK